MIRKLLPGPALLAVLMCAPGCTQMFAKRAIEQFAQGLENQDIQKLRDSSSEGFERTALRTDDSAEGIGILKVPTGKVEVVGVEDLGDGKSRALVKVGEKDAQKEVEYRLTREKHGKWVVDDVIMQQDSGRGQVVERSVSEQMDLVLSCRELLITWRGGNREPLLATCAPPLRKDLEALPAAWLTRLAGEIADPKRQGVFKPEARLQGQTALVVVPHPQGKLMLKMGHESGSWLLTDMALEPSSRESTGIRNLRKMVRALNQSSTFLASYGAEDLEALKGAAAPDFYKNCLAAARLSDVNLPVATLLAGAYECRQFTDGTDSVKRMELVLRDREETYMLSLREADKDAKPDDVNFVVEEVTLFSKDARDVRRLSALFLSRAMVNVYVQSLRERDVRRLREISSANFNDRVWNKPEAANFGIMPEPVIPEGDPQIIATAYRGDISEVTIAQGDVPMTFVLQSSHGWVVVDDVLMPAQDRPTSLKSNLEVLLPIHGFAGALTRRDIEGLLRYSADGLDRMAWRQLKDVPESARQLVRPLLSEVSSITQVENRMVVKTTDGHTDAVITLAREGSQFVVHDVSVTPPRELGQKIDLLAHLRTRIASGEIGAAVVRDPMIMQAGAEQPAAPLSEPDRQVVPASAEQPVEEQAAPVTEVRRAGFGPIAPANEQW